ncbi:MAG: hypothetical protein ACXVH0_10020, partial [Thermoanaerobaculia bacterium]
MSGRLTFFIGFLVVPTLAGVAAEPDPSKSADKPKALFSSETFSGIKLREIGPAVTSGRIADIAVVPGLPGTWVVGVASGGVWKTT